MLYARIGDHEYSDSSLYACVYACMHACMYACMNAAGRLTRRPRRQQYVYGGYSCIVVGTGTGTGSADTFFHIWKPFPPLLEIVRVLGEETPLIGCSHEQLVWDSLVWRRG